MSHSYPQLSNYKYVFTRSKIPDLMESLKQSPNLAFPSLKRHLSRDKINLSNPFARVSILNRNVPLYQKGCLLNCEQNRHSFTLNAVKPNLGASKPPTSRGPLPRSDNLKSRVRKEFEEGEGAHLHF